MADKTTGGTATQPSLTDMANEFKTKLDSLGDQIKTMNTPDFSRVRYDDQNRVTSYFEDANENITLNFTNDSRAILQKSYKELKRESRDRLKSHNYAGWNGKGFKSFGDFVKSGLTGHQTEAFRHRCELHFGTDLYKAILGMNETAGADGGFAVMPEFSTKFIDRIYANDLWGRTDNYTVSGNNMTFLANAETSRATGSRHGGLSHGWYGEGTTIESSKPTLRQVNIGLVDLCVNVYLTNNLLADSGIAMEQYVSRKVTEEFNFALGNALINGVGGAQPLGMLNAPSLVSVAKEAGQLAATLDTENIVKMYSRFYAGNLGNAIWLHNQDIGPELDTMSIGVGTGGMVTYMPPGGLSASPYATLRGRPMIPTEFNATLGTQGDILLADLSQILSISKGSIEQAVSIHVAFLTDQTALRFKMRLNARPWETAPITPFKGAANTQSSFVALDTRA